MNHIHDHSGERAIIAGDLNARHNLWDSTTNQRGMEIVSFSRTKTFVVTPPKYHPYKAKGRPEQSKSDLLLDRGTA